MEYEKSCQYCGEIIEEDVEQIETGHGSYHKECYEEYYPEECC